MFTLNSIEEELPFIIIQSNVYGLNAKTRPFLP